MHIGLDNLYYAKITENASGEETYGTPQKLSKAISASLSVNPRSAKFYADDALDETFDEFGDGTLSLNIKELTADAQKDIFGIKADSNGVLVSCGEDSPAPVAILFRSLVKGNKYGYFVFYRVQFAPPGFTHNTKTDSITINTPTIEGTIMRRHKADFSGDHPWRAQLIDDGTATSIINSWFTSVYEPVASGNG